MHRRLHTCRLVAPDHQSRRAESALFDVLAVHRKSTIHLPYCDHEDGRLALRRIGGSNDLLAGHERVRLGGGQAGLVRRLAARGAEISRRYLESVVTRARR